MPGTLVLCRYPLLLLNVQLDIAHFDVSWGTHSLIQLSRQGHLDGLSTWAKNSLRARGILLALPRLQMEYRDCGFRIVCGESAPVDDSYAADNPEDGLVGKTCILKANSLSLFNIP